MFEVYFPDNEWYQSIHGTTCPFYEKFTTILSQEQVHRRPQSTQYDLSKRSDNLNSPLVDEWNFVWSNGHKTLK